MDVLGHFLDLMLSARMRRLTREIITAILWSGCLPVTAKGPVRLAGLTVLVLSVLLNLDAE